MEENIISEHQRTCFYISMVNKTYGVIINVADLDKKEEIIKKAREQNKECIEAWKKEWGMI